MVFAIDPSLLGIKHYLICEKGKKPCKSDKKPSCRIVTKELLYELHKLYLIEEPEYPPEPFRKAYKHLLKTTADHKIPWLYCIPSDILVHSIHEFVNNIANVLDSIDVGYYDEIYSEGNGVFAHLQPMLVDKEEVDKYKAEDTAGIALSFRYDEMGWAELVQYDRLDTLTGRLRVVSGPEIQRLPKNKRSIIRSRFGEDGGIFQLDYQSVEPRVMYSITQNTNMVPDVYDGVNKTLFAKHGFKRDDVKTMVLSLLYGSGLGRIEQLLPHINRLEDILETISEYFGLKELRENLISEHERTNRKYITNYFGRRIDTSDASNYMLVNYHIQSTAMDLQLIGFTRIANSIKSKDKIIPIAINCDALYFDVHKDGMSEFLELKQAGDHGLPMFDDITFHLRAEPLVKRL